MSFSSTSVQLGGRHCNSGSRMRRIGTQSGFRLQCCTGVLPIRSIQISVQCCIIGGKAVRGWRYAPTRVRNESAMALVRRAAAATPIMLRCQCISSPERHSILLSGETKPVACCEFIRLLCRMLPNAWIHRSMPTNLSNNNFLSLYQQKTVSMAPKAALMQDHRELIR